MHCLANFCYVCLEKKDKLLSNINSSLSVNKDIIHIIGYLPFNLAWLKTLRIVLICEECCLRLRDMYQFLEKWVKNRALLQSYMDNINTSPISNTENVAELLVKLNTTHKDMNELQSEDEEIYTFQWQPNIEAIGDVFVDFEDSLVKEGIISKKEVDEKHDNNFTEIIEQTEDVFVNVEDYFVKEEKTWKQEEVDYTEEYPTDNNSTENMDNESDSEISVSDDAHLTNTNSVISGFTYKQPHATNKNDLNTAAKKSFKCSTCSKSFFTKSHLNIHIRIHTDEKSYECAICKKRFSQKGNLVIHMRVHTGEKPYSCLRCRKCFSAKSTLVSHMQIHSVEKSYVCFKCHKWFTRYCELVRHIRTHTGVKPYKCSNCNKYFANKWNLVTHMRLHTGEKPYECSKCKKCFTQHANLLTHMRIHTGEQPYSCSCCKKCFSMKSSLVRHIRLHTGEKPYNCSICKKCFVRQPDLVRHMRIHTGEKP